jgi:transcriptional regulator with XRE-family HTH domain
MKTRQGRVPDPVDRHVGARIRERRIALAVMQAELGRSLDLSEQQIRRIERGSSRLAPRQILALASRLKVDSGYFLEGAPATLGAEPAGPEVIEIIESFRAIQNDGMRRDLFLLVQAAARHSLGKGLKEKRT